MKPVLLYGSEIWGYFSHKKFIKNQDQFLKNEINKISAEKVHTKFCTFVLGVRTKSANSACRVSSASLFCVLELNLQTQPVEESCVVTL
jgi:hypothetical protein